MIRKTVAAMLLTAAACQAPVVASQVLLWRHGTAVPLQPPLALAVADECRSLLLSANDTVLMVMNARRLAAIKRGGAVEIIFDKPAQGSANGAAIVFDRILVPLGSAPEGLVLFSGRFGSTPGPGVALDYGAFTFVVNARGISALRDLLKTELHP